MDKHSKIYVAGHKGMVGSAVVRILIKEGYQNIIFKDKQEVNLTDDEAVNDFFQTEKPQYVILAAARVGGIQANVNKPGEFLYENLVIQNNVIHSAHLSNVEKLVFLGSSCIYPKECPQPMKEEYLLTGKLEPTNEGYALAKICGLKLIEYYNKQYKFNGISLMPCNLYGTNDSFHPEHSHVLSSMVRKFCDAKEKGVDSVELWGTGIAKREFMHVDDAAKAILFLMINYHEPEFINIGWGKDISIKELAKLIASEVGFEGQIKWDHSKPDGMLRKCMDVSRMYSAGFFPQITLSEGVRSTIREFNNIKNNSI
ncbi:MAG: GDP-L-fucose synthase family protein [Cyclobacteriaceae bacterium]